MVAKDLESGLRQEVAMLAADAGWSIADLTVLVNIDTSADPIRIEQVQVQLRAVSLKDHDADGMKQLESMLTQSLVARGYHLGEGADVDAPKASISVVMAPQSGASLRSMLVMVVGLSLVMFMLVLFFIWGVRRRRARVLANMSAADVVAGENRVAGEAFDLPATRHQLEQKSLNQAPLMHLKLEPAVHGAGLIRWGDGSWYLNAIKDLPSAELNESLGRMSFGEVLKVLSSLEQPVRKEVIGRLSLHHAIRARLEKDLV